MIHSRSYWLQVGALLAAGLLAVAQVAGPSTAPQSPGALPTTTTAPTTRPLPSAADVLGRFITATGGREAYLSITSRHVEAEYQMADLGVSGKLVADIRADGEARQVITVPNLDTFSEGITGGIAWSYSQTNGARLLNEAEARSLRQSLALAPELTLDAYASADVVEIVEVNGVPCYKMVLVPRDAPNAETRYYDVNSGYLIRRDNSVPTTDGPISITTRYGDYEDAPPIRIAKKVRQSMSGLSPEQIVTQIVHNEPIADEVFALPPEVTELLKHRAAAGPATTSTKR